MTRALMIGKHMVDQARPVLRNQLERHGREEKDQHHPATLQEKLLWRCLRNFQTCRRRNQPGRKFLRMVQDTFESEPTCVSNHPELTERK